MFYQIYALLNFLAELEMTYDGASKASQCHLKGAVRDLEIPEEYLETYKPN
jgi:hypothetical protein